MNENSPACQKLECGDILLSIGNFSANDLRHEEALNLIRMFDLTLTLVVRRYVFLSYSVKKTGYLIRKLIIRSNKSSFVLKLIMFQCATDFHVILKLLT